MTSSEQEAPKKMGERSNNLHQNPLKMLELMMKGFCPAIILDRVEIHDGPVISESDRVSNIREGVGGEDRGRRRAAATTTPFVDTAAESAAAVPTTEASRYQLCSCGYAQAEHTAVVEVSPRVDDDDDEKKPFEIGERPPSDVIGISKKIWQSFCSNTNHHHNNSPHRRTGSNQQTPPTNQHWGFCGILTDQYRALCLDMDDEQDLPPEGEEVSVSTSVSGSSVDLSPQWSPRGLQQLSAGYHDHYNRDEPSFIGVSVDTTTDTTEDEGEEEEDEPMAEFEVTRSYRGIQVLIATLLAVGATFVLLQNLDAVNHQKVNFVLQPKRSRNNQGSPSIRVAPSNNIFADDDDSPLTMESIPSAAEEMEEKADEEDMVSTFGTEQTIVRSCEAGRIENMLSSPFGQAFMEYLADQEEVLI